MSAELATLIDELKQGKIYIQSNIDFGYGDQQMSLVLYSRRRKAFYWQVYNLHGNGEELSREAEIEQEKLPANVGHDVSAALLKITDRSMYPFVSG